MATATPPGKLTGISPKAYEHPADRAATAALKSIPMLDVVTRRLIEFGYERALRQAYLGGSIKVGERQLPDVWASYLEVLEVLDMPDVYDLYVTNTRSPTRWRSARASRSSSSTPACSTCSTPPSCRPCSRTRSATSS